jgi:hypothetical protein
MSVATLLPRLNIPAQTVPCSHDVLVEWEVRTEVICYGNVKFKDSRKEKVTPESQKRQPVRPRPISRGVAAGQMRIREPMQALCPSRWHKWPPSRKPGECTRYMVYLTWIRCKMPCAQFQADRGHRTTPHLHMVELSVDVRRRSPFKANGFSKQPSRSMRRQRLDKDPRKRFRTQEVESTRHSSA